MTKGKRGNKEVKKPKKVAPVLTAPVPGVGVPVPAIGGRFPPPKK